MDSSGSVFERPPAEWTDGEIRVGLAEVARSLEFHSAVGDAPMVEMLHEMAMTLADERDRRVALARAVDEVFGS